MANTPTLQELNSLGMFSGRLSEVHCRNLDSFPFIYFNGVKEVKLGYDISHVKGGDSFVHYDLTLDQENDHMDKRFSALQTAIKALFWKEVALKLSINGKEYRND